jgi:hypothetical protein
MATKTVLKTEHLLRQQLEAISAAADTLATFAADAAERAVDSTAEFHAIQAMAERIGVIADISSSSDGFSRETRGRLLGPDAVDVEASHG